MRCAVLGIAIVLGGCGVSAQTHAVTALAAACDAAEQAVMERHENGKLTREEAILRVEVTGNVCGQALEHLTGGE